MPVEERQQQQRRVNNRHFFPVRSSRNSQKWWLCVVCCGFYLLGWGLLLVINFDENIKKNCCSSSRARCVCECGMTRRWKEEFEFFYLFRSAIIIDNYLECGWGMEITAVVCRFVCDGRFKFVEFFVAYAALRKARVRVCWCCRAIWVQLIQVSSADLEWHHHPCTGEPEILFALDEDLFALLCAFNRASCAFLVPFAASVPA